MKTLVGTELAPEIFKRLQEVASVRKIEVPGDGIVTAEVLLDHVKRFDPAILVIEETPVGDSILNAAPSLSLIICVRGNPVNINLDACKKHGVIVTNTPHRNAVAVAEFTVALMLSIVRKIPEAYLRLRQGEFSSPESYTASLPATTEESDVIWTRPAMETMPYDEFQGIELAGRTLGLVGFGGIGSRVAAICRAFGMTIVVCDPYYKGTRPDDVAFVSLDGLAAAADIITLHAIETPETIGLIDDAFFRKVKSGSYIVNTSRGRLIDRRALTRALGDGTLAGAALDVFDYEPLSADDPLITMDRVICTPHIGGASRDVLYRQSEKCWEIFSAFICQDEIPHRLV